MARSFRRYQEWRSGLSRLPLFYLPRYADRFNDVAEDANFVPVPAKHVRLLLVKGNETRYGSVVQRTFSNARKTA